MLGEEEVGEEALQAEVAPEQRFGDNLGKVKEGRKVTATRSLRTCNTGGLQLRGVWLGPQNL